MQAVLAGAAHPLGRVEGCARPGAACLVDHRPEPVDLLRRQVFQVAHHDRATGFEGVEGGGRPAVTPIRAQRGGVQHERVDVGTVLRPNPLAWARKGAKACRFPVEVREIFFVPAPE